MLVVGIDIALRRTGVAAIQDGKVLWKSTIAVTGDRTDTGPRYAMLRRSIEKLFRRTKVAPPALIVIEQPEHGLRKGRSPEQIMKLYGAFCVCYAECDRIFPKADIRGVMPETWKGNLSKDLMARMMSSKYDVTFENNDESDAVALADYAWDLAVLERKRLTRGNRAR